jgi:protein-S-isoprenylcysteine O-methyltransferase Ste14
VASPSSQDPTVRLGGWLFRQRSWLPLPIIAALVLLPHPPRSTLVVCVGLALVTLGEALRVWGVRHIGVVSRTRSDRLGPLVASGPFGHVRNPLYLGNVALWLGFTIAAGLLWLAPLILLVLAVEYHPIVRWEEGLLTERLGEPYRAYCGQVPRWLPAMRSVVSRPPGASPVSNGQAPGAFTWRDTLFSERSTLLAVALGCVILWLKS